MKIWLTLVLITISCHSITGQTIGIGTENPEEDVVLHVHDPQFSKGMLVPFVFDTSMVAKVEGALIYYTAEDAFYYYTSGAWKPVGEDTHFDLFYNTFVGEEALANIPFGPSNNTAFGRRALKDLSDAAGERNTAIGANSQEKNIKGFNNTSLGYLSLAENTQSNMNVALGNFSLLDLNASGPPPLWTLNTAVGTNSVRGVVDGLYNTAVGGQSMFYFSKKTHPITGNTALGYNALHQNPGSYNIAIGHEAGANDSTSYSLFIDIADIGVNSLIYGKFNTNFLALNGDVEIKESLNVSSEGIQFSNGEIVNRAIPVQYGIVASSTFNSFNIGEIKTFAKEVPEGNLTSSGLIPCDGRAIDRTTYSQLFDLIGTAYGSGDGSTTFNVPDFRNGVASGSN